MVKKNPRAIQHFEVALDKDGNMLEHWYEKPDPSKPPPKYSQWWINQGYNWIPNCIFADTMEFVSCHPTNGSAHFIFRSINNGRTYSFFLSDFEDVLKAKRFTNGNMIHGEFTCCKKGSSQGVRLIIE